MMQNSMLSLCLIWGITVVISICISLKLVFEVVKELADNGYCLSISSMCKISNSTNGNHMILLFIPLINIMYIFMILVSYYRQREILIDGLSALRFFKRNVGL